MSSMLRQHHVRIQDLVNYLRGYDPAKPQSAEDWSKQESAGFEPGMLIFCLERVSAPSGLAFGKKESEGETYRVKDLCVVVGRDANRSLVVNITASAFELRYLEVLMLEKARKAILDGKDFLYVAVKPAAPLPESKLREVEELGAMYAQGGSRRSLVVDASGPQEPAVALLAALGVKLSIGGIGKQVLDIGSICHMLFAPEGRTEDKNKAIVKGCFAAIPNNEPIGKGGQTSAFTPAEPPQPQTRVRPAPPPAQPPQDWGPGPSGTGWASDLQTPATNSPAPSFGYDQGAAPAGQAPGFGYDQGAAAPAFGYDSNTAGPGDAWHQPGSPSGGFGLSGLDPFAPPAEPGEDVGQFEHTDLTPPDFSKGFNPPPDNAFGQAAPPQFGADQFPPSSVFNEQQFNNEHFQAPDFSHAQEIGGISSSELPAPPQQAFGSMPAGAASDDMFQPPYEGAQVKTGEHPKLPSDLTSRLDPQNQLFQAPDSDVAANAPSADIPEVNFGFDAFNQQPPSEFVDSAFDTTSGAFEKTSRAMSFDEEGESSTPFASPAPNASGTGFPAMSPTSSSTDLPSMSPGSSSTGLPAMPPTASGTGFPAMNPSASGTGFPAVNPSASSTGLPAASPTSSSTNLPAQSGWGQVPTEDWASPAPPSSDWGTEVKPTAKSSDSLPWTPEPSASDWAPEPVKPMPNAPTSSPGWDFEGAAQAPAWNPEPAEEPSSPSSGWNVAPAQTPASAETASSDVGVDSISNGPSLFERLNQQLQKGSISEIEPPPTVSLTGSEPAAVEEPVAAVEEPAATVEPAAESSMFGADGVPIKSVYADTPLPPPVQTSEPPPPSEPLPLGVSKKSAPLILDWPSAADFGGPADTADNLPAATPAVNVSASAEATGSGATTEATGSGATAEATGSGAPSGATGSGAPAEAAGSGVTDSSTALNAVPGSDANLTDSSTSLGAISSTAGTDSSSTLNAVPGAAASDAGGGIKHLAEALSGLMEDEAEPRPVSPFANMKGKSRAARQAEEQAAAETAAATDSGTSIEPVVSTENVAAATSAATESATETSAEPTASAETAAVETSAATDTVAATESASTGTAATESAATEIAATEAAAATESPAEVKAEAPAEPPVEAEEELEEEEEEVHPSAALAAKGFQEPRLVMNEMASLMSKLEQQVQKAAKKLNTRAEEIRQRLQTQVDGLVADATQVEKESQRSTTNLSQRLIKSLDDVTEESRLKVSDVAANGRYTIKQLLTSNQNTVDESKNGLYESLREACKQFRIETEALARTAENDLNELVTTRTDELNKVVQDMNKHLDGTNENFNEKLNARFDRFKERMSEEAASVVRSLERNVHSMVEEIDGSWDRASDKLKSSKNDFEQTVKHSVKTAELNLSQSTRLILTNALIPKLRERQHVLRMTSVELSKRFSAESESQVIAQIAGLESSLGAARQQLQALIDECMASIDSVGRGQQAGLEEIFKETSAHAERATTEVTEFLNKIETQINDNEQTCKRLAETSSIDNDPELSDDRNAATQRVQQLRQQANTELFAAIDQGCNKLEQLSNNVQGEVSAMRVEQTQAVRDAAENGLTRVRDAIQEAFSAIQAAREKYME